MTRLSTTFMRCLWLLLLPAMASAQQSEFEIKPLSPNGGVEYSFDHNVALATNGVIIRYGGAVLTAERVQLDETTGEALAEGKVLIQRNEQVWSGERIRYNFKTREIQAEQFRTGKWPAFAAGEGLRADITNDVYVATNTYITSDDISRPTLKIRASYVRIVPGEKIVAHHAILYLGGVPVFYFPVYSRNLGPSANGLTFVPGYRNRFGPFLLGTYTWYLNEILDGAVHVDYRERRGIGGGPDFNYHLGRWGDGTLKYYYLHDEEPTAAALPGTTPPENRQRLFFTYQSVPATNLEIKGVARYQSDSSIIRDFFESEYRQNPQPNSFLDVHKFWQNFSLETYAQPRVNDFYETVERLPDVRLTGFRQQILETPVFYESESSAGYYHRRFAETNGPVPGDFAAARADTFHQLLLPHTFFGWLNVTPRVGGRLTYYSHATGDGASTSEESRGVFNTGVEFSFKASRVWPFIQNKLLDVHGLRHIVEPTINYVFIPSPTHPTNELPPFDYELPSFRLLPIDFPDYNAIDSIDSQHAIRFGVKQKLQTKRQNKIEDVVNWDVYTDWRIKPNENQKTFADLYSDLIFRPRSWLKLESLTRFDLDRDEFRLAFHTLTIQPSDTWSWSLGHFYLREDLASTPTAFGVGNNLFTSSFLYRLNENYAFRATQHFEARDGRMEEQSYTFYRDLRSWTAALTFRIRDNRVGPDDFTVAFTFSLKAFPRYGLGTDSVRPYYLLGS